MSAVRREYMKWRARDVRNVIQKQRAAAARPPRRRPAPFRKPFAERMVDPSFSEQRKLEALLWPRQESTAPSKRTKNKSVKAAHFVALRAQARTTRIAEYLEMYHVGVDFITTEAGLNAALETQFAVHLSAVPPGVEPQTYEKIVEEVESGRSTEYDVGYAARIRAERKEDVVKALTGKLAGGRPGPDEVLGTIRRAVREQERRAKVLEKKRVRVAEEQDLEAVEEEVGAAEAEGTPTTEEIVADPNLAETEEVQDVSAVPADGETSEPGVVSTIETEPEQDLMEAQDKDSGATEPHMEPYEADITAAIEDVAKEQDLMEAQDKDSSATEPHIELVEEDITAAIDDVATEQDLMEAQDKDSSATEPHMELVEEDITAAIDDVATEQDLMEAQDKDSSATEPHMELVEEDITAAIDDVATEQDLTEVGQENKVTVTPKRVPHLLISSINGSRRPSCRTIPPKTHKDYSG
jgi:hypothetical protein